MASKSQFGLLRTRRFGPFFVTQCLGALNDNVLRNGLVMLLVYAVLPDSGGRTDMLANAIAGLFLIPFLLFSPIAGQLADKFDKALLIRRVKLLEVGLMVLAMFALIAMSTPALLVLVFAMGLQSTLFGPIKYAILPQLVSREELMGANGVVEGGTYLAIIIGLYIGGYVATLANYGTYALGAIVISIAILGYFASGFIKTQDAADATLRLDFNVWKSSRRILSYARKERSVFLAILGLSWFWAFGLVALAQLPAYAHQVLFAEPQLANLLLVSFAVGIGIGSLGCEMLSRKHIELGLVPLGSLGLSLFALDVYFLAPLPPSDSLLTTAEFFANSSNFRLVFDLVMIGVAGGFFSVPLYALILDRSDERKRSRIIAANNILNAIVMIMAAVGAIALLWLGVSIPGIFLALAVTNALVAIYIYTLLPEFLMRFLSWILINLLYRIRVENIENIPKEGPALLIANHVSFVDALLIGGAVKRPVRFVMYYKIFQIPLLSFLFKTARAIPIAGYKENPQLLKDAYDRVDEELADGRLVCIFPEGAITHDGALQEFRSGMERILDRRKVPVIPIALKGLWGSWFSRKGGGAIIKLPRRLRARITIAVGPAREHSEDTAKLMAVDIANLLDAN